MSEARSPAYSINNVSQLVGANPEALPVEAVCCADAAGSWLDFDGAFNGDIEVAKLVR